ncbi:hypothetical protein, partial [Ralstonia solanacearum]
MRKVEKIKRSFCAGRTNAPKKNIRIIGMRYQRQNGMPDPYPRRKAQPADCVKETGERDVDRRLKAAQGWMQPDAGQGRSTLRGKTDSFFPAVSLPSN